MNCYSRKIDIACQASLKDFLIKDGAVISAQQSALWRAKNSSYNVVFYNTGKLLVQGSDVTQIVEKIEHFLGICASENINLSNSTFDENIPIKHIGTDESGKGDFFGPLIVAAVLVDESSSKILLEAGIKDCKKVDDKHINKMAAIIKNNCPFSVITINPLKYNELYAKFGNLNKLLAWGHARAIENVLQKSDCDSAISDKFGDESLIKNALINKAKNIQLIQRCKAESDIAVAAASVLARAGFLAGINQLTQRYGIEIPKGASDRVLQVAKSIANEYSKEELKNAVKTHFKTYLQV